MNKYELLTIYKQGRFATEPQRDKNSLSLSIDDKWFILPKKSLTQTEITLLQTVFEEPHTTIVDTAKHPWYAFLMEGFPIENVSGAYRIIQFNLNDAPKEFQKDEWLHAFASMFHQIVDYFFLEDSYGILIEKKEKNYYSTDEIEGIILTLEADFLCKVKIYIGEFLNISEGFPAFYQEERTIFSEESHLIKSKSVFTLSHVALHYFTKKTLATSLIMKINKKKLAEDRDISAIILALWNNQGNISSTAKELFMHRNTLQYRLDKFYEQTGLSLRTMDDLVLAYLLVHK